MKRFSRIPALLLGGLLLLFVANASAAAGSINLIEHPVGFFAVAVFVFAYVLVMAEERLSLRKSKPVLVAAGIIWILIGWIYTSAGESEVAEVAFHHTLNEFAALMLFLLVAMTYINAMEERRIFDALREWMIRKGFSYRTLFWVTGVLSFLISPIADNLTTALLMCAVIVKVADDTDTTFINIACVNVVVAPTQEAPSVPLAISQR